MEYGFSLLLIMITFFTSWQNEMLLDRLTGSLNDFIGFNNGSYFIEVPEGKIDEFFQWDSNYPDLISAHRGGFTTDGSPVTTTLDIAFADLNLIQNEANTLISVDGNNLAILFGVETDSLSVDNFVFG